MPASSLLDRISEKSPGGIDVSGEPEFIQLTQKLYPRARVGEAPPPADYDVAERIARAILTEKSKDLQVAVYFTEAALQVNGYKGLREGLELIRWLLENLWPSIFPTDLNQRRGILAKLGAESFARETQLRPLTEAGHTYWQFRESRSMPTSKEADEDQKKRERREAMLSDGKVSSELFDAGVEDTTKQSLKELVADVQGSLEALRAIDAASRERFGKDDPPSFRTLRLALEAVAGVVEPLLAKRLEEDPDPQTEQAPSGSVTESETKPVTSDGSSSAVQSGGSGPVASAADAETRVVAAAQFLRKQNPRNPTPYFVLRALRWGELRFGADNSFAKLLVAPRPDARPQLRSLYVDGKWGALLEAVEQIMGTPAGRGWLDLQFYAVKACEALQDPYDPVRRAIISELRSLLADIPSLPDETLMDMLPAAAPETRTWIANQIAPASDAAGRSVAGGFSPATMIGSSPVRDVYSIAKAEAAGGNAQRAIALLVGELSRETSERARFLRRTQVAEVMVEQKLFDVARPLLQQLIAQIEKFTLAEWEDGAIVAQPLALMIRCMDERGEGDSEARNDYYLRVCTLNPVQALSLTKT
jgi:type VI secretion system protein ImpA